jgi:PAS domain S-box-containing protein
MAKSDLRRAPDLDFIVHILGSLPDLERLSQASPPLWLNRFLNRVAENCEIESCVVIISSRDKIKIPAKTGIGESDAESVAAFVLEKAIPSASGAGSRTVTDSYLAPIQTFEREGTLYHVMRHELPADSTVFTVFAVPRALSPQLTLSLRVLGGQIAAIIAATDLAASAALTRAELDRVKAEVKEMQMCSLNIMEDLQNKNRELNMLNEVTRRMASWRQLPELARKAAEAASQILDGAKVVVFAFDRDHQVLRPFQASDGVDVDGISDCSVSLDHPLMEAIAQGKEAMVDLSGDTFELAAAKELGLKTGLILPLLSKDEVLGFLLICENRWHRVFTDSEVENLRVLTSTMAVAMENAGLMARLTSQVEEISILKEYIETVVDSVDLAIMVVDESLKITMFNYGFKKLFGYKKEDFLGRHVFEAFPHLIEQGLSEVVQQVFRGKPFLRYAWKRKLLDGSDAIQNFMIFPHRNASGKTIGAIAIIEDVTAKVNLEDQLAKSEAKFSRLVEDLDDGYLVVAEGKVLYANKAVSQLTGVPVHELIGIGVDGILADPHLATECLKASPHKLTCETKINHNTGTWIPVELHINTCEYGGTQGVSLTMRDITDRKKIETQLEAKNREMRLRNEQITRLNLELEETLNKLKASQENLIQSERVAAITETSIAANHEINNPLFAVLGQAQLLLRKYNDLDEETVRRLKTIEESALRIACVTKKLANLADPVVKEYSGLAAKMIDVDRSTAR